MTTEDSNKVQSADAIQQKPLPPPPAANNGAPAWPPANATIIANGVSKSFGGLVAVSAITFAIEPGVTALLGPNGAGKSTLIRLLCGLAKPSSGTISVAGGNPREDKAARARIGLVPQQDGVFERETALATVELAAVLSNMSEPTAAARSALDAVELDSSIERPLGTFSKGMRQRVKIAQAIVHQPDVLILDEPLNGLDPRQRRHMIKLFHDLGTGGRTVLVSSHVLDEVERFGSHVIVVAKGRLAAQGDFRSIRSLMENQPLRLRLTCTNPRLVAADLVRLGSVDGCQVLPDSTIELTTADVRATRLDIPLVCQRNDSRLEDLTVLDDDLESVFRYLIGPAT